MASAALYGDIGSGSSFYAALPCAGNFTLQPRTETEEVVLSATMLCPHCNAEISDDAAICNHCDAILDEGFFNADVVTAPKAPAVAPVPFMERATTSELESDAGYAEPPTLDRKETGGAGDGTSILRMDPEQHKDTRIVNINELGARRNPAEKAGLASRPGGPAAQESQLDDFWGQIGLAFRRLRPLEKVALITIGALILGAFLPWYTPRGRGSISGIEVNGWLTALLAFGALVTFWVRVSLRIVLLVLLQVGLIVGAALVAGFALANPGARSVSFGIYFTLLAGGSAAVVSLVAAVKA